MRSGWKMRGVDAVEGRYCIRMNYELDERRRSEHSERAYEK